MYSFMAESACTSVLNFILTKSKDSHAVIRLTVCQRNRSIISDRISTPNTVAYAALSPVRTPVINDWTVSYQ
jgi:hypothetical protein